VTDQLPAPKCCYIAPDGASCGAPAEWLISSSPFPDQMTEACSAHVGELLDDAPEHRVWPLYGVERTVFANAARPPVGDAAAMGRVARAAHAMQTGVALHVARDPTSGTPKHLRVSVNAAIVAHDAVRTLLITKGVCTAAEYDQALAVAMEAEATAYEDLVSQLLGRRIGLL
jgi:hypothetical protein